MHQLQRLTIACQIETRSEQRMPHGHAIHRYLQSADIKGRLQVQADDAMINRGVRIQLAVKDHTGLHSGQRIRVFDVFRESVEIFRTYQLERFDSRPMSRGGMLAISDQTRQLSYGLVFEQLLNLQNKTILCGQRHYSNASN